jgi:AraC-like DNA-binding protein
MESIDRLSALLERFRVRAHLFHSGALCGLTTFDARPGRAFLHLLKRGEMAVLHPRGSGAPARVEIDEPTLLFYPRALEHSFENPPEDGADLVCATLDFDGGSNHPLAAALPPVLVLPLRQMQGLAQTLELLFAEAARVQCGQRLLADRLFEVLVLQLLRWLLDHAEQAGLQSGLIAGLSHPRLARVLTAIHEEPGRAWTLATMADTAGMSRSAFAATFRDVVDSTPADYLQRWRIAIVQSLLREGVSLKAASFQLGYRSPASLSRAFTQILGESPRLWLQSQSASA